MAEHDTNQLPPQELAEACAEAMYERDLAVRHLGIKILRMAPGEADLQMSVSEIMIQGHASCHGGYLFTLADSAFAYACNSYDDVQRFEFDLMPAAVYPRMGATLEPRPGVWMRVRRR